MSAALGLLGLALLLIPVPVGARSDAGSGGAVRSGGVRSRRGAHRPARRRERDGRRRVLTSRHPRDGLPANGLRAGAAVGICAVTVLLFGIPVGMGAALVAAPIASAVVQRLSERTARRPSGELAAIPLVLDLLGTVLDAGQPIESSLHAVRPAASPRLAAELEQVASLLRLGASPADAWARVRADPLLRPVAETAVRSAESGVRLAQGFRRLAGDLRSDARAAAMARAQRVGVWAVAPLGLCFLPAFGCLGIIPTIIGIASGVQVGPAP